MTDSQRRWTERIGGVSVTAGVIMVTAALLGILAAIGVGAVVGGLLMIIAATYAPEGEDEPDADETVNDSR